MKATEQYFPVVLFIIIMLYKVVLTFELWMKPLAVSIQMKRVKSMVDDYSI